MKYQYLLSLVLLPGMITLGGCFDSSAQSESGRKTAGTHHLDEQDSKIIRRDSKRVLLDVAGLGEVHDSTSNILKAYFHPVLLNMEDQTINADQADIAHYQESVKNHTLAQQSLDAKQNLVQLSERDQSALAYIVENKDATQKMGKQLILPIEGKGYLSMLKGYLSLDLKTLSINRIRFYEHGETPSLGGNIMTNDQWLAQFNGKQVLADGQAKFKIVSNHQNHEDSFTIDGISGATNTSHSVENMVNYWMSESGYNFAFMPLQKRYL